MANYYIWSGATGVADGSSWADAFTTLAAALAGVTETDGDIFYIASDHNEMGNAAQTFTFGAYVYLVSTNRTSGLPEAGAVVSTSHTGANHIIIEGKVTGYGVNFRAGVNPSGGTNLSIFLGPATAGLNTVLNLAKCTFEIVSAGGLSYVVLGRDANSNNQVEVNLTGSVFKFAHVGQGIKPSGAKTKMDHCSISPDGVAPTYAFAQSTITGIMADMLLSGCDFSWSAYLFNAASIKPHASRMRFNNCIIPDNITTGAHPGPGYLEYFLQACGTDTDDAAYQDYYLGGYGTYINNTGVYLTTGGSSFKGTDGTPVPMSLMMTSSAYARNGLALFSPWYYTEITTTGSKTVSMKLAHTLAAALKDNEAWLEVEFMSEAGNPLFSCALSAPAVSGTNVLDLLAAGSNLTDTAEAWTGITGEITHTLSKTITVNQKGFMRARVALAKPSTTIYLNEEVVVS